ncbi:hypothetical protein H7F33_14920 [Pedobacter sp. PAMC26386]|nr:hypothetical protein H7F33_14920 [Pedobacter sp. PAMC26386]
MKRIILAAIIGVASFSSINANAQVSLNIKIGSQPTWGPAGYNHVDYYYLPDVDSYYNVSAQQYVYQVNNQWVFRKTLPARYSGYNLYNGYKVVMNTPKPYLNHSQNIRQYSKYKNYNGKQGNIRDSKDNRYAAARNQRPVQARDSKSNDRPQRSNQVNEQRSGRDNNRSDHKDQPQRGGRER